MKSSKVNPTDTPVDSPDMPAEKSSGSKKSGSTPGVKVRVRNAAVHILYRRLIGVAIISVLAATLSLLSFIMVLGKPVPPQYIPVTPEGYLIDPVPLDKPNLDHGGVGTFALEAIHAVNTYDYINWRDQLSSAERYFSTSGWNNYKNEYDKSATLNAILSRKMIVSVQPTGEINFVNEGIVSKLKTYVWQVEVPVEILFTAHARLPNGNIDAGSRERGIVTLYISRVPLSQNAKGLAIQIYIMAADKRPSDASTS